MDINEFEEQTRISLSAVFTGSANADLQCVLTYLASIPDELAFPLLLGFIGQYPKLSELQIQNVKRDIEVKAHNIETNLKWMKKLLQRIPDDPARTLKNEYLRRYKKYPNGRSSNIWLRKSVEFIDKVMRKFPVPLYYLSTEARRTEIAHKWSSSCSLELERVTEQRSKSVDAIELITAVKQPADLWGFCPCLPNLKKMKQKQEQGKDISDELDIIARALARLIDEKWWLSQLEKAYKQFKEHAAIIVGKVRSGVSPYVSYKTLIDYQARKTANSNWIKMMMVVNEEHELELPLIEAVKASISNPENRRTELMVRMRGFEQLAEEHGYIGEFYTWTAPSKYHSWTKNDSGRSYANAAYQGATPRDTQQYLCKQWAKVRAKFEREKIEPFGFRVVEPHHDGTPHWHLLLFFKPEQVELARQIICEYAVQHDKEELNIKDNNFTPDDCSPRFDYKTIDPAQGSATGYLAKYIAKNIDGAYVDVDYEAESSGKHAAEGVAAWASTWRIRQFQQIGGAPVTVWRELRRLRKAIVKDDVLERARKAADAANWQGYIEANGGLGCKRGNRPVKLAKIVNEAANRYGEDIIKIIGVMANTKVETRLEGWKLQKAEPENTEAKVDAQCDEAVCSLSSDNCASWRSDNNCTEGIAFANFEEQQRHNSLAVFHDSG
ncbi:replication endonuclease [Parashewanella spongiae]|uniref:Replication endonuclease n=1 Tax=Parashewanella spongiae TaxID=342950 RepID=A0A3A6U6Z1_9GAMM|nr:replication endonuclease [Parashewanella spongiae]MCL1077114.1 replication endonuclease [Parashewanella spongiae]RJY17653.1 replication endonuclease [Parashewanella spongiae]